MTKTRIADNVAWHIHQEVKKIKKERDPNKNVPGDRRIDARFNDWAKRNGVDLQSMKLMKGKRDGQSS